MFQIRTANAFKPNGYQSRARCQFSGVPLPQSYTDPMTGETIRLDRNTSSILNTALKQGWLTPGTTKQIFEFGPGPGNSTLPLSLAFPESQINAVDESLSMVINYCHWRRPNVRFSEFDGIQALEQSRGQYNLIAAIQFGPDESYTTDGLSAKFLEASQKALQPGGRILVSSDMDSMSTFLQAFNAFQQKHPTARIQQHNPACNSFSGNRPTCEFCVITL